MTSHSKVNILNSDSSSMKMMELFAGIGGMRSAAIAAGLQLAAVHPYEINPSALLAYSHNFPDCDEGAHSPQAGCHIKSGRRKAKTGKVRVKARNLLGLTVEEWEGLKCNLLTMSPPCQPFTRQGLQLDTSDPRSQPLAHILKLLRTAQHLPAMLLLENVKGFDTSEARSQVVEVISARGYLWREFLLCSSQLGVPNSRLRYYLLAVLRSGQSSRAQQTDVEREFPLCLCFEQHQNTTSGQCFTCQRPVIPGVSALLNSIHCLGSNGTSPATAANTPDSSTYSDVTPTLGQFLRISPKLEASLRNGSCTLQEKIGDISIRSEKANHKQEIIDSDNPTSELVDSSVSDWQSRCEIFNSNDEHRNSDDVQDLSRFELKPKVLSKYAMLLDIVDSTSRRSCCFTKGYGRLMERTGSVYNPRSKADLDAAFKAWLTSAHGAKKDDARSLKCVDGSIQSTRLPCGGVTPTVVTDRLDLALTGNVKLKESNQENVTEVLSTTEKTCSRVGETNSLVDFMAPCENHISHETESFASFVKDRERPCGGNRLDEASPNEQLVLPLLSLKLRHFTPAECLSLMCFPPSFSFPPSLTERQQFQLIGNSVNVLVVTVLLMFLQHWHQLIARECKGMGS